MSAEPSDARHTSGLDAAAPVTTTRTSLTVARSAAVGHTATRASRNVSTGFGGAGPALLAGRAAVGPVEPPRQPPRASANRRTAIDHLYRPVMQTYRRDYAAADESV